MNQGAQPHSPGSSDPRPKLVLPVLERSVELSDAEFERFRWLIYRLSGIALSPDKKHLLRGRLQRRLRELGLSSFTQYHQLIQDPARGEEELVRMLDEIATNTTEFFREASHFDYLGNTFFPLWKDEPTIRILSAGCSTGQEPYSIAMTALEALGPQATSQVKITAIDLSTRALGVAKEAVYEQKTRLGNVNTRRLRQFFLKGSGSYEGLVKVGPKLQEMVQFRRQNLIDATGLGQGYHAVFCCNVVIYFDQATQRRLFDRFHEALLPGGNLFLGHSESLMSYETDFEYVQPSLYRRGDR